VHRDNLQISFQRYRHRRCQKFSDEDITDDDDEDNTNKNVRSSTVNPESVNSSKWGEAVSKIKCTLKSLSTVLYLDFVRDVEDVAEFLKQDGAKVGKYTGKMSIEDQKQAKKKFLQGEIIVLVATESYELGVDNLNISQVIRIGCPHNLGGLLQELDRAGRKPNTVASGLLLFNEVLDDKRLGL